MFEINIYDPSLDPKEFELPVELDNAESKKIKLLLRPIPRGKFASLFNDYLSKDKALDELKKIASDIPEPKTADEVLAKDEKLSSLKNAVEKLSFDQLEIMHSFVKWGIAGHKDVSDSKGNILESKTDKIKWVNKEYDVLSDETLSLYKSVPALISSMFTYVIKFNTNEDLLKS